MRQQQKYRVPLFGNGSAIKKHCLMGKVVTKDLFQTCWKKSLKSARQEVGDTRFEEGRLKKRLWWIRSNPDELIDFSDFYRVLPTFKLKDT